MAGREAYLLYVERPATGRQRSRWALLRPLGGRGWRSAPWIGPVVDSDSELIRVRRGGTEQETRRRGRDLWIIRSRGLSDRCPDREAVPVRHVVQVECSVQHALESRHREHEGETEGQRAPPPDDGRQQNERARGKGERWGSAMGLGNGEIRGRRRRLPALRFAMMRPVQAGVQGRVGSGDRPVPGVSPGERRRAREHEPNAHHDDQPEPPAHGRDPILTVVLRASGICGSLGDAGTAASEGRGNLA